MRVIRKTAACHEKALQRDEKTAGWRGAGGRPVEQWAVWYICAMRFSSIRILALAAIAAMAAAGMAQATGDGAAAGQTTAGQAGSGQAGSGQTGSGATAPRPVPRPATAGTGTRPASGALGAAAARPAAGNPASPAADTCENGPCDEQPAHIAIATPAPAPAAWPLQDRIEWVAKLLLVVVGLVGIMVGISTLKKIEQQAHYAEAAAEAATETAKATAEAAKAATDAAKAATDTAKAVFDQVQAVVRAERPWVLVTVEPSRKVENRFAIMATNRGRGPARILSSLDKITTEVEESRLPETPELGDAKANASLVSVILLPGESTGIGSFGRDEVKDFCATEEKLKRVENWEEMILLYGKIVYQELIATANEPQHETCWCFWYIHGRRNSGMVAAGTPQYHRHT
jgi:hypothetical protein